MASAFSFKGFEKEITKELRKEQKKAVRRAVKPFLKEVKANIDQVVTPHTGNLRKGLVVDIRDNIAFVGMDARKAPHALLVELGSYVSGERFTTGDNSKSAGISSGIMPAKAYFLPAFRSTEAKLIAALGKEWF